MSKKTKKNKYTSYNKINYILLFLIIIVTFLAGIGYAQISGIFLRVNGIASVLTEDEIVISNVVYLSNTNADVNNSSINSFYHTMLDSTVALTNNLNSSITYRITMINLSDGERRFVEVLYDSQFYDNEDIVFELDGIDDETVVDPGDTITFDITFKYRDDLVTPTDMELNSYLNFVFDNNSLIAHVEYNGNCVFSGQGNDVTGACVDANYQGDYIDTGIALFSQDNYMKDFEIGFNIDNIAQNRFRSGQVDTVFSCLYENSPYPGITLRIQNSNWYLQVGNGTNNGKNNQKITIPANSIQSFKLARISGQMFYSINGDPLTYVTNASTLSNYFNDTLTFGVSLDANGDPMPSRYLVAELSDLYLRVTEPAADPYAGIDQMIAEFLNEPMTTVFESSGQHTFDGTANTPINTGVALFSQANYQKSFVVTLYIDSFDVNNQVSQATLFNAKDESNNTYPGILMRLNGSKKFEVSLKDGANVSSILQLPATVKRINFIKKGMLMYYQYDYGQILPWGSSYDITNFPLQNLFNVPATFGSNINGQGQYDRIINGVLSGMKIQLGN